MPPSHSNLDATRRALAASEARYRRLIDLTPVPMWIYDRPTLQFLYVNRAMAALYGFSTDELLGMTMADVCRPGDPEELARWRGDRIREPRNLGVARHRRKDGGELRVDANAHDVEFEGKRGRVVVASDLTARMIIEEELRETQRDLEAAASAGHVGSWVSGIGLDAELRFSPETFRILGLAAGTPMTVGKFFDMIHPDDRPAVEGAAAAALERGSVYEIEHRVIRGDGTVSWVHECATVERDEGGRARRVLGTVHDVTDRRRAEDERDRFFSMAYDAFCITREHRFVRVNRAFTRLLGFSETELLAAPSFLDFVHPEDVELTLAEGAKLTAGAAQIRVINRYLAHDGTVRWLDWIGVRDPDTGLVYGSGRDITQERAIEDRLAQSQKLEAIGQLAGGIAHDFNNILSVIRGGAELLRADLRADDPLRTDAGEIIAAAERAATLTRQLLAFSRKQFLQPVVLDLNERVKTTVQLLRRLIGEHIELGLKLAPEPMRVKADPAQVEQVLINLAVNARDAMPAGGRFSVETSAVTLDDEAARAYGHIGLRAGPYVLMAVSDTGRGMEPQVLRRVFEPFFTTKKEGRAAGLGLATAYGIVKQSGGGIWVYSETGVGTTFKIYLPRTDGAPQALTREPGTGGHGQGETILLVEDEPMVRHLVHRVLQRAGFDVLEASNGGDALMVAEQHHGTIDLLLTDVIMPRMNGRQLADRLRAWHPTLRVVYMSGYTEDAIIHHGLADQNLDFIAKPIAPRELIEKIRDVLDRPAALAER